MSSPSTAPPRPTCASSTTFATTRPSARTATARCLPGIAARARPTRESSLVFDNTKNNQVTLTKCPPPRIAKFARRTTAHVVEGLETENLDAYKTSDDVTFVMHLRAEDAGKGVYKRYHDLAQEFHDRYSFGIISRADQACNDDDDDNNTTPEQAEPPAEPSVLHCYNNVEGTEGTLDRFFEDTIGLRNFVEKCTRRLVQPLGRLNANHFLEGSSPVLYYFDSEIPKREAFETQLKDVARRYADQVRIVTVDPMTFPEIVARMTLQWEFPAMALQNPTAKTISLYSKGDIDEEIVERYIRDVLGLNPPAEEAASETPVDEGVVLDEQVEAGEPVKVEEAKVEEAKVEKADADVRDEL